MTANYGSLLNTVDDRKEPCPRGHRAETMRVYERAVTWTCGAVTWLPPIPGLRFGRARRAAG